MRLIALWLGKIIFLALKALGRQGAALPGLVVETIYPKFIVDSLNNFSEGVVIITGTNGKTTTTKMLSKVLKSQMRVLTNPSGSNFTRGIASVVVRRSNLYGNLPYDIGVFELDEAYAAKFAEKFAPRVTVVLNITRDQMDRFGEIDYTAKLISKIVAKTTDFVILNCDDSRVLNLKNYTKAKIFTFGVANTLKNIYKNEDELTVNNKNNYKSDCTLIKLDDITNVEYLLNGSKLKVNLKDFTTYNIQNLAAVMLTASKLGVGINNIIKFVSLLKPAFGRGEKISLDGKRIILQLVKNPSGFRQALISSDNMEYIATMIAINDEYADGRDVSWLWDVNFSNSLKGKIITTGTRATDMSLRLKHDGILTYISEEDLNKALNKLIQLTPDDKTAVIYTTYTAMLKIRKIISRRTKLEEI